MKICIDSGHSGPLEPGASDGGFAEVSWDGTLDGETFELKADEEE